MIIKIKTSDGSFRMYDNAKCVSYSALGKVDLIAPKIRKKGIWSILY